MISNEEQRELLKAIKKRPDVRKLNVAVKVCGVLGFIGFVLGGLGIILLIVASILARKRDARINQILSIEGAGQEQKQDLTVESVAVADGEDCVASGGGAEQNLSVIQKQAAQKNNGAFTSQKDEGQAKIEKLVSLSKRHRTMECLFFGTMIVGWIALFFLPFGKLLGIENISAFQLLQERIESGEASFLEAVIYPWVEAPDYVMITGIFFWAVGLPFLIIFVVSLIFLLIGREEGAIRASRGEIQVALTRRELQQQNAASSAVVAWIAIPLFWGVLLAYPISLFIAMKELVTVPVFTIVAVALLFIFTVIIIIADGVLMISNRKEYRLIYGIVSSYRRYKHLKR